MAFMKMSILLRKTKESIKNQKAGTAKYTNIGLKYMADTKNEMA